MCVNCILWSFYVSTVIFQDPPINLRIDHVEQKKTTNNNNQIGVVLVWMFVGTKWTRIKEKCSWWNSICSLKIVKCVRRVVLHILSIWSTKCTWTNRSVQSILFFLQYALEWKKKRTHLLKAATLNRVGCLISFFYWPNFVNYFQPYASGFRFPLARIRLCSS